jgi:hypothetical protein
MAQTPEQKAAKYLIEALSHSQFNEVAMAHRLGEEHYDVNARFWNVIVSFIYYHAYNYEIGQFPNDTYEIARLCKKIKDLALSDEYTLTKYALYGDYELHDLTAFDKT